MPITITHLEKGIYLNIWEGRITLADLEESKQRGEALLQKDEVHVVLINDLSQATHFPMDINALKQHAERIDQLAGMVMVNTPIIARTIGEVQAKLHGWSLYFVDTLDEAIIQAHAILAKHTPEDDPQA